MLNRMKLRLPDCENDELLQELLQSAGEMICAYTGREAVPEVLQSAQIEMAAILFNRLGMEGEAEHVEGSVRHSVDSLPEALRRQMNPHRRARVVEA